MEITYVIDPERMNQVLRRRRLTLTWEDLLDEYARLRPRYRPELFSHMTIQDVQLFSRIFEFKKTNIMQCRRELSGFVKSFPEFYGDSLDEVFAGMSAQLKKFNQERRMNFPYVNWLPDYGGMIQPQPNGDEQIRFMEQNGIPYSLTGRAPGQ